LKCEFGTSGAALMELPPWPKTVDPWLQRTAWGLGITLGVLTLITNYIIPYFELFMPFTYITYYYVYAYLWYRNRGFLNTWSIQFILVPCIAVSVIDVFRHIGRGDGYGLLVGCLWLLSAAGWFALSVRAEYEKYVFLWGFLAKGMLMEEMLQESLQKIQGIEFNEEASKEFRANIRKAIDLMPPESRGTWTP
jgi:hypothetical protein